MNREMTKTEKILDNIALTSVFIILLITIAMFTGESTIVKMPIVIRYILLFLHQYSGPFLCLSLGILFIAGFWSEALKDCLDDREQERSQKYISSNDSNTKSRLELTKLKERG